MKEDSSYGAAMIGVLLVGLAFTLGAWATRGGFVAGSVLFGAALALANLWALGKVIRAMIPAEPPGPAADLPPGEGPITPEKPPRKGSAAAWGVFAVLKVLLLFGLVLAAVELEWIALLPFTVGYGAMPVGIVVAQLARGMRSG